MPRKGIAIVYDDEGYAIGCPSCGSPDLIRYGFHSDGGKQRWQCKSCNYRTVHPQVLDEETLVENVRLARQTQRFRDRNRIERKAFREFSRLDNAVSEYNDKLIDILRERGAPKLDFKHEPVEGAPMGIMQFSDVHFNELVHAADAVGNVYDFDVASRRCKKYVGQAKRYFKAAGVKHVLVAMTGDMLNSDRRLDELLSMATNRAQATVLAVEIMEQLLLDLHQDFALSITCVSGNEARIRDDHHRTDILASDNYDWTIFEFLSRFLSGCEQISFIRGASREIVVNVNGQNVLFLHGESLPNHKGVEKEVQRVVGKWADKNVKIHFVVFGHYHSARIGDMYARSSSMTGANVYSDDNLQLVSKASQNIHIVWNELERDSIRIGLQDTEGITGYAVDETLKAYNVKSASKTRKKTTIFEVVI